MNKKVYFAGSIRGGRADPYFKIYGYESEHEIYPMIDEILLGE